MSDLHRFANLWNEQHANAKYLFLKLVTNHAVNFIITVIYIVSLLTMHYNSIENMPRVDGFQKQASYHKSLGKALKLQFSWTKSDQAES